MNCLCELGKAILPDGWSAPVEQSGEKAPVITPAILENGYVEPDEKVSGKKNKSKQVVQDLVQERTIIFDQIEKIVKMAKPNITNHIVFLKMSKNDGKIFGSVSVADIQREFLSKFQIDIPKEMFADGLRLKTVGEHQITIQDQERKINLNIEIKSI